MRKNNAFCGFVIVIYTDVIKLRQFLCIRKIAAVNAIRGSVLREFPFICTLSCRMLISNFSTES